MNIGFISSFNFKKTIGGVENHILFLSQELQNIGCNVTIFLITDSNFKALLASTNTLLSVADMLNVAHDKTTVDKHTKQKNLITFIITLEKLLVHHLILPLF